MGGKEKFRPFVKFDLLNRTGLCVVAMLRVVAVDFSGNVAVETLIIYFEYSMWQAFWALFLDCSSTYV